VHALQARVLARAWSAVVAGAQAGARDLGARLAAFETRHAAWLEPYARGLAPGARERWVFAQLLAHEQHAIVRARARALGLALLADLQIGASGRDRAAWPEVFLPGWRLGAPPSRTNPEGQPWGYPLLDPLQCRRGARDAALALFSQRIAKLFDEYDGVRVDHPHGLVDPWVYRDADPDPVRAVQRGARLFGAPHCAELARFAIAAADDLNPDPRTQPWDEDWVVRLSPGQVDRYATLLDELVAVARARGRDVADVACEVLSTLPYPLARVLERHGLGRFRVTQKADPADPRDGYRSEHAAHADWIMVGTHDTPPIWALVPAWQRDGSAAARAARLAERLAPAQADRTALAETMTRDARLLALGHFAELFASPARQVMVFFSDLFGLTDVYNEPGTLSDRNWSLRLPPSWRRDYAARVATGHALDLPRALALALRARGLAASHAELIRRLDAESLAAPRALLAD
jgi:4-alpha-glucanotransferase